MSCIRMRPDGRYELRFYYNKKQYSVYDKNVSKLKKKKADKLKELKTLYIATTQSKNNTYKLNDWYKIWLETYKKPFIKPDSLSNIKIYFEKHILKKFGNWYLDNIKAADIQQYLNRLEKNRTKEFICTYFNACLQKAADLEYITKNPFILVVKDKAIKKVRPAFTIDQQEQILTYVKSNDFEFYKLIMFYLATGVRRSEALSITKSDFDENILHIKGTKTYKSDRRIKITDELKKLIIGDNQKLFDYKEDTVTSKFKAILRTLKIEGTLHCLRHSYATNQYYLGTPAKEVQIYLGHTDVNMTLNVYTNIDISHNKTEIIEKIKKLYNNYYIELKS